MRQSVHLKKVVPKTRPAAEFNPAGQGLRAIIRDLKLRTRETIGMMGKKWTENARTTTMGLRLGPRLA